MMRTLDMNTPVWQLTVGELIDLVQKSMRTEEAQREKEKELVYGIDGLARLLGCSKTTAQIRKSRGDFDSATYQTGRKVAFDKAKILDLIKK